MTEITVGITPEALPVTPKPRTARRRADKEKGFPTWAKAVLSAVTSFIIGFSGIWLGFFTEKNLQRTEVSVASKNEAYNEIIRAGDAALTPAFIFWAAESLEGEENAWTRAGEDLETQDALRDAANRLRLVIDADDVHLINDFVASLSGPSPGAPEGAAPPTPGHRLVAYSEAKLALVNEFRSDVLGEGKLPADEADRMLVLDQDIIKLRAAAEGAAKITAELAGAEPSSTEP